MKSAAVPRPPTTPVARMIASKQRLVARLKRDIAGIREKANEDVAKVEFRIRQANAILDALEKGTLKP